MMKLVTTLETMQISGGAVITVDGHNIYVNTVGIPNTCVAVFEQGTQEIVNEANNPNSSSSSIFAVMGKQLDRYENAGCMGYLETFSDRFASAHLV